MPGIKELRINGITEDSNRRRTAKNPHIPIHNESPAGGIGVERSPLLGLHLSRIPERRAAATGYIGAM
jgi:hypothetical protein